MATARAKNFTDMVSDSVREVWLTGLGAISALEEEGSKLYSNFVEKGKDLSKDLERKGEDLEKKFKNRIESYSRKDDINMFFDEKMKQAFETIGVSTHSEVKELTNKVDKLSEQVAILAEKINDKAKKPGPKPTTTK